MSDTCDFEITVDPKGSLNELTFSLGLRLQNHMSERGAMPALEPMQNQGMENDK